MHIHTCTCIIRYFAQVNCIDMTPPIVEELKSLEEEGVMAFDVFLQTMVFVVAPVICTIHGLWKLQITLDPVLRCFVGFVW